jgi:hypothetical protein
VIEVEERLPSVDEAVAAHAAFRDHISCLAYGEYAMEGDVFPVVAMMLFSFIFNTYKAVGLLLPGEYYEQAATLYRTMWEAGANLAWIALDPEERAKQFAEFTGVEYRHVLQSHAERLASASPRAAADEAEERLRQYETLMDPRLSRYTYSDGKRWRDRFSCVKLDAVTSELGSPWSEEYRLHYRMGCSYTHGAPGAVLSPLFATPEAEAPAKVEAERTSLLAVLSMELMQRCLLVFLAITGRSDDGFLEEPKGCTWRSLRESG